MKANKLILVLTSTFTIAACSIANATPDSAKDYNIYVYQDCKTIQTIAMDEQQIAVYQALRADELKMTELEQPLEQMDEALESYEMQLAQLSEQLVFEDNGKIVVNKSLVEQHKRIANKIKQVVASYQTDINKLELQADQIKHVAQQFKQVIAPSLEPYQGQDIQVQIGNAAKHWDCQI